MLVGPSAPPMIETPFLLFCSIRLFLTNPDLSISLNNKFHELTTLSKNSLQDSPLYLFLLVLTLQS